MSHEEQKNKDFNKGLSKEGDKNKDNGKIEKNEVNQKDKESDLKQKALVRCGRTPDNS